MARNWMQEAFGKNKGRLHRVTNTPEGQPIPISKIRAILKSKSASTSLKRAAALALRVKAGDLRRSGRAKQKKG